MTNHHGMASLKGLGAHCKRGHEATREDRFGRMFPDLAPAFVPRDVLEAIGRRTRAVAVPPLHWTDGTVFDLEAIVSNEGSNNVTVLAWDDTALYTTEFTFDVGMDPSGVAVGELDGDGVPDIVVSSQTDNDITVILSDP